MVWVQWKMAEATAEINPIHERVSLRDPARSSTFFPVWEFGAVLRFLGASVHLYLAEDNFLFLRKDRWDVLGGPLHSKSSWPRPGLAQGNTREQGSYQGSVGSH